MQYEVRGDTTIARTVSGSEWGDSVRVDQELSIGQVDGPPEYQFAFIQALAVDSAGGIYAFDSRNVTLRYYDANGRYVRTIGRRGQGPGEYGNAVLGMAVRHRDGRLLVYDIRNMRINVYNPDGSFFDEWRVNSGLYTSNVMVLDTADNVYVKILGRWPKPGASPSLALMHLDASGQVQDTLWPPNLPDEPTGVQGTFLPSKIWAWSPLDYFVAGVNRSYDFELGAPGRRITRIERAVAPVAVKPEEKSELDAVFAWMREYQGHAPSDIPRLPDVKPAYESLLIGQDGRIWVSPYLPAEEGEPRRATFSQGVRGADEYPPRSWFQPNVMDVFRPDGAYLGAVRLPPHVNALTVRGDLIWAVRRDSMDVPYVVRLRVKHGEREEQP